MLPAGLTHKDNMTASANGGRGFDPYERSRGDDRQAIRVGMNGFYFAVLLGLSGVLFLALPLYLLPQSPWWALLALPIGLSGALHWGLIHEATHNVLHPKRRMNRLMGRALGVVFLCPFDVLRFGHLCHHALNGRWSDRPELYDPGKTPRYRAWLVYYFRLFFGLYGGELICPILAMLPRPILRRVARSMAYEANGDALRMPDVAEKQLTSPERLRWIRMDALLIFGLWALAFWLYAWWIFLFFGVLIMRGWLVSFLDNAPHYGTPLGDVQQGHDTYLPPALRWLVLNGNFHGTHHRHPTLPWSQLAAQFEADGIGYRGRYLAAPWRQLRGPMPQKVS